MEAGLKEVKDMNETHDTWLRELDEASRSKQEAFLNNIASRLKRPRVTEKPQQPFRGAPELWEGFRLSAEDNAAMFTRHFTAAGGYVIRVSDLAEAGRVVAEKAAELGARRILRQDQAALTEMNLESLLPEAELTIWNRETGELDPARFRGSDPDQSRAPGQASDWKARAAEADIGIVQADYAVAYTGSITVLSAAQKGRSVSLLPAVLFAVIPASSLVTRLGEVLTEFDRAGRERLPAGIHFISGPSRSADIENDLTIGVHGPGIVHAVLVDDVGDGINAGAAKN